MFSKPGRTTTLYTLHHLKWIRNKTFRIHNTVIQHTYVLTIIPYVTLILIVQEVIFLAAKHNIGDFEGATIFSSCFSDFSFLINFFLFISSFLFSIFSRGLRFFLLVFLIFLFSLISSYLSLPFFSQSSPLLILLISHLTASNS
jgi:hypothetical protein